MRTRPYDGIPLNEDFAWKLWFPADLTEELIRKMHCPQVSHGGFHKTLNRIRKYLYWPNQSTQVRIFVERSDICKETKAANMALPPPMGNECITEKPFHRIFVGILLFL